MEQLYAAYKPLLFSIAYRMMGTILDAEDIVQEAFMAVQSLQTDEIKNMKAYLCKLTMNRCLNELKSARKRRETYFGEWLPEPLIAHGDQPFDAAEANETLSYAFLVMLDRLSPMERAVFVLRTAFGFDYGEIARIVDKNEANCRKLFSNANKRLETSDVRQAVRHDGLRVKQLERFVTAFKQRNVEQLLELLTEDAVLVTDGGGRVRAAVKPIFTRERIATLLDVISAHGLLGVEGIIMPVNGQEEVVFIKDNAVIAVLCIRFASADASQIDRIYIVMNPDKLKQR
ncbi:hypothetical protein SD70_12510 [Gordoniibacillus kamchatkensis]|uniref:RNA polymerase sigma-70 factor n=2 Tax=Gordoniibacillus kamchatkensis TaxID=1590651 RepID=A0ABR5AHX3_9BACL|nr:hypothetical protein SD70_12510 [Paenibacillus sp. VKM B-2647]